jgi:predicted nuclease of predicted toxin-antitoxin system
MILFDENIEQYWILQAIQLNLPFISVRDSYSGVSDEEVIEIARKNKALVVTEDKDFGELVFAHGITNVSVMLIRYDKPDYHQIQTMFLDIITNYNNNSGTKFMVLSGKGLRVREL